MTPACLPRHEVRKANRCSRVCGGEPGRTAAVKREVEEEVVVNTGHTDSIVALLNDESNEVGKVHLGIVHFWNLDEPNVDKREQMITQMSFMSPDELQQIRDTLETWSQKCLDGFDEMVHTAKSST